MRPVLAFDARRRRAAACPRSPTATSRTRRSARIPLTRTPAIIGGGPRRDRRACRRERRRTGPPRVVVALPPRARCCARRSTLARGRRGEPAPGAGLRPRPAHAVQARGGVFRRHHRRRATRSRRSCASTGRRRSRRSSSRRGGARRAGARRWSPSRPDRPDGGARRRRKHAQPAAARRSARTPARGADGRSGCRSRLIAVAALFATALPLWQKRGYAIALQQLGDPGARRRPMRRMRCASSSSG